MVTALGLTAASFTTLSFAPQLGKVWRTKSANDLSYGMLCVYSTGIFLWLVYGLVRQDLPLILSNGMTFLFSTAILALKVHYSR